MSCRALLAVSPLAVSMLVGCSMVPGVKSPWPSPPPLPDAFDFAPEAPVIVLRDRRYFDFVGQGVNDSTPVLFVTHRSLALRVQRATGLDAGTIELPYARADFVRLEAASVQRTGERAEVGLADAREFERFAPAGEDGGSRRATVVLVPRVTVGSVIELNYTVRSPRWQSSFDEVLDERWPVVEAEISFRHSIDVALALRSTAFVRQEDQVEGSSTLTRFTLERWRPEALHSLAQFDATPRVQASWAYTRNPLSKTEDYAALASWEVAASWLWDDVSAFARLEAAPAGLPAQIRGLDEVQALFDWVQSEIASRRALDGRAFRPVDAVVAARAGGSADRALLLYALLARAQAADLRLVVLPETERGPLRGWPAAPLSPGAFTYLVRLRVGDAEVYLDPSCVGCRAGELGAGHARRHGLALRPTEQRERLTIGNARTYYPLPVVTVDPVRTPADPVRQPRASDLEVELTPRGLRVVRGWWRWRGARAAHLRAEQRERGGAPLRPAELHAMLGGYAGGDARLEEAPTGEVTLHLQDALLGDGGYVDAAPHAVVPMTAVVDTDALERVETVRAPRDENLSLPSPVGFVSVVRLRLAAGDRVVGVPRAVTLSRAGARYTRAARHEGDQVIVEESLHMDAEDVPSAARPELVRFVRELRAARREGVVLERSR